MIANYQQQFDELVGALREVHRQQLYDVHKMELCFITCFLFWENAKKQFHPLSWKKKEQIFYLKHIRPLFTSQIQYYQLCYAAAYFKPDYREQAYAFWLQELLRLEKFTEENLEFYNYYKKGYTYNDEYYFLIAASPETEWTEDHVPPSLGSYLVTRLLALEHYSHYVEQQLDKLQGEALGK
jgi:hypothetical protein